MKIRKTFKFEAAHRVRSSTGSRCKNTIHGHSYICEVILYSPGAVNMVMDFGDLKQIVGEFFDCLDHATFIWEGDDPEYLAFIRRFSHRVVWMQMDPTAENMARAVMKEVHDLLREADITHVLVEKVIMHETATGYAEASDFREVDLIEAEHPNDD